MIFWSLIGRSDSPAALIAWQAKQESQGKEFSLRKLILRVGRPK